MLEASRASLAPARQTAQDITAIQGGNTVAQHFANALRERYSQLPSQQLNPGKAP
jgi:triphosphoribosyl-dephospho-CoA synthetase